MAPDKEIMPFLAPLAALQKLLARFGERGVVIGGVAASLLGKPRLTADVDVLLLLELEDMASFLAAAAEEGIVPRIPDAEEFAMQYRVLLLRHQQGNINVDVSLGMLPFEVEAVERSKVYRAGSVNIRLPTPEDLIILKAVAHRPKDLEDIRAIIERHPSIDKARIKQWVQDFAVTLDMPELWDDLAALL